MTALPPHAFTGQGSMGLHVMAAMAHFGTSRRSDRKAEVTRFNLQGHSSKVIARMPGKPPGNGESVPQTQSYQAGACVFGQVVHAVSGRPVRRSAKQHR